MAGALEERLASSQLTIRDFGVTFARMVAGIAVDPHGYFEKKYTARIAAAHSDNEINGVLAQLVQWATSSAISDIERARLDRELATQGLPSVAELRLYYLP